MSEDKVKQRKCDFALQVHKQMIAALNVYVCVYMKAHSTYASMGYKYRLWT